MVFAILVMPHESILEDCFRCFVCCENWSLLPCLTYRILITQTYSCFATWPGKEAENRAKNVEQTAGSQPNHVRNIAEEMTRLWRLTISTALTAFCLGLGPGTEKYLTQVLQETAHRVQAKKLEYDYPPYPNPRKKENQHKTSQIHIPTFWSLL